MFEKYKNYIKDNPQGYWFKRKWFGWGWTPVKWQGWLVTAIYVAIIIALAMTLDNNSTTREIVLILVLPLIILTALFLGIAYKKGEKPKWQWGIPKDDKSKE